MNAPIEPRSVASRLWAWLVRQGRAVKESYASPIETLRRYWRLYGGIGYLLRSPYFHAAVVMAAISAVWSGGAWTERLLAIVPSLLGFSMSSYAMLLAFGSDEFLKMLARAGGEKSSVLGNVNNVFAHFIIVQVGAILFALLSPSLRIPARVSATWIIHLVGAEPGRWLPRFWLGCDFLGWLGLFYAITCGVAAGFRVYRQVGLYVVRVNRLNPAPQPRRRRGP